MVRNIIIFLTTAVFILFFSSTCLCQDNANNPANTAGSATDKSADKDAATGKTDEKDAKTNEEVKKEEEKDKEKKKEAEEEDLKLQQEETIESWDEYAPKEIDHNADGNTHIWKDDQGFIDR